MSILLSSNIEFGNATVTLTHSRTKNLEEVTKNADILIAAIGKPSFINKNFIKNGAVVIDVGINRVSGKLHGDVDFDSVKDIVSAISPVPGGVGLMTRVGLLMNTLLAADGRD
jgi:methylenetetrahydrofolate dehydrogenase (NADP+)/methenyltetrahydrofolate cyclohydrolase